MNPSHSTYLNTTLSVEMLQRFCDGDHVVFQHIHDRLNVSVRGFLIGRFPGLPAQDIIPDLWLEIWQKRSQFNPADGISGFRGWVFTIARRRALDQQRKVKRTQRHEAIVADPEQLMHPAADGESLEFRRDRTSELLELDDCLQRIPTDFQRLIHGKYWQQHSNQQLAQEIETTENQISRKLSKARKMLADCMKRKRTP